MAFRQRLTAALCAGLLLAGCSQAGSSDSTEPKDTQKEPAVSETTRILTPPEPRLSVFCSAPWIIRIPRWSIRRAQIW